MIHILICWHFIYNYPVFLFWSPHLPQRLYPKYYFILSINEWRWPWLLQVLSHQWTYVRWRHCSVCVFCISLVPKVSCKAHTFRKELGPALPLWRHFNFWGPPAAMTMAISRPIYFGSWLKSLVLIQLSHLAHVSKIVLDKTCSHCLSRGQSPHVLSPSGKKDDKVG